MQEVIAGNGVFGRFAYLALNHCLVVLIGLGYWAVAARMIPASSVGLAAAAVSAAMLVSALGALGVGSFLLAELRRLDEDPRAVTSTGILVVTLSSGVLALLTVALSPFLGHNLSELGRQPVNAALLVLCTVLTGAGSVLDAAAVGIGRSRAQVVRNVLASTLRFGIIFPLIAIGVRSTEGLLLGWDLGLLASLSIWPWLVPLPRRGAVSWKRRSGLVHRYRSLALHHHILNLAITSVTISLPALAGVFLVAKDYAYFAVAQLISSTALRLPALLSMSLFAEATGDAALLRRSVRRTLPVGFVVCLAILLIFEPFASLILSVFGHAYASQGASTLRLLLIGGLAYVVKDHYVAIRRAQRRLTDAARAVALGTVAEMGAAVVGAALYGVRGLCTLWLLTAMCEAAFFLPVVWKLVHRQEEQAASPDLQWVAPQ